MHVNGSIEALLFDLDGTLIDSMPLHDQAWLSWHARRGLQIDGPAFFAATAGRSNNEILGEMFPAAAAHELQALADEKEALYRALAADSLALIDGARCFVREAAQAGLRLAVCTASTPENMALAFAKFGVDQWVQTIVSPADGLRGKPHPDIFFEAARRLQVAPERCLVFEDAPLGVEAARRAGMRAVALTTTLPATAFAGFPNVVARAADFSNLGLDALTKADHHA
jgi:beta-phosphoglucomutase